MTVAHVPDHALTSEPLSPRDVDERLTESPVTLARIRRSIPTECFVISPWRSWGTLLRVFGCAAVLLALLALVQPGDRGSGALLWQVPALVALWVLYGWVLVGLFVLGHDCGHRSFSRRRWVNTLVGHVCLAPLANAYQAWRLTHDHHHAYTQLRGQDVDWASYLVTREEFESGRHNRRLVTRLGYALPFGVFFWIWWNSMVRGVAIHTQLAPRVWEREKWRLRLSGAVTAVSLLAIYGTLWYATGFWGMLKYHGIPATIAMITGWVLIAIQHANEDSLLYEKSAWTPAKGQMVSTFDTRFPRWIEVMWCSINFHIPHHVAPGVPWYHLEKAARALRVAYPDEYQERRFHAQDLLQFRRTPFLRKVEGEGYFVFDAVSAPVARAAAAGAAT